ncbi:MAG: hypothetical protein Q9212_003297 [Teloschistes hypoglaucus]
MRPFAVLPPLAYGGMMGCVRDFLWELNQAVQQTNENDEDHGEEGDRCAICHDTVRARSDRVRSSLYVVVLPQCGHRFHEICLLNWLSPIALPPTSPEESIPASPSSQSTSSQSNLGGITTTLEAIAATYGYRYREETDTFVRLIGQAEGNSDDDLEEGEVREHELMPQTLPYFNLFNGRYRPVAIFHTSGAVALSHSCPLCRVPAFFRDTPYCHGDNLIFLRMRMRLAELARECCRIPRNTEDLETFNSVTEFMERRFHDNLALGEREATIDPTELAGYFLVARLQLIEEAVANLQSLTRRTEGRMNGLLLLINFLRTFTLRNWYSGYFFDPALRTIDEWDLTVLEESPLLLWEDPESFCAELRLKVLDSDRSSSSRGGPPFVSEQLLLEARRAERENNVRFRMAISSLIDDSHDNDVEMEEVIPASPVSSITDVVELEEASFTDAAAPQSSSPTTTPPPLGFSFDTPPQ